MNLLFNNDGSKREYTLKQNGTYRVSNLNEPCGEYLTTTSAMKEIENIALKLVNTNILTRNISKTG